MAILPHPSLFSWKEVEATAEIERLRRLLGALPDAALIGALESARRGRRNDHPVRAMWHAVLAGIVFGHASGASLRRELARNGELWEVCGFDPLRRAGGVSKWAWSRFLKVLLAQRPLLEAMFEQTLGALAELLPDFGRNLAVDGKAIATCGKSDSEAGTGYKNYEGDDAAGEPLQKIQSWFGYKLHLMIDADYELPLAWELTPANVGESPRLLPLVERLKAAQPALHARAETLEADRGYDSADNKTTLHEEHRIAPVIPARALSEQHQPLDPARHDAVYLSPSGEVCCKTDPFNPDPSAVFTPMQCMGFEAERKSLKFRCPAAAFGVECKNREACACVPAVREGAFGRVVRVELDRDRRLLGPIYAHSPKFKRLYAKRTAIERVNSRIDQVYGLERHFIRGLERMRLRLDLTMLVMLGTALAWARLKKPQNMRSLLKAA
jgi:hypothetical protein